MSNRKTLSLIDRMAARETELTSREFFAPVIGVGRVAVRIGEVTCSMKTRPPRFRGYGIFRTSDLATAELVREASLSDRRQYLNLFPQVRLLACFQQRGRWMCSSAQRGDSRIRLAGLAPVEFAEDIQPFETINSRFCGQRFWFDSADVRSDPATPAALRSALREMIDPESVVRRGLTVEQRAAYDLMFSREVSRIERANRPRELDTTVAARTDSVADRLSRSLSHAGAELIDYAERGDGYRVTYRTDGSTFTSSVNKADLSVQVAGICLDGFDEHFDLASLVGVLREGRTTGQIYRM